MKIAALLLVLCFYVFFFTRAALLRRKIKKSIKARDSMLNFSIILAGFTSLVFILQILLPSVEQYIFVIFYSNKINTAGIIFIFFGLLLSSMASLNLGNSWRIGVNPAEKTKLIMNGIYSISRNPYFLSYDIVLIGMSAASGSLLTIISSLITIFLFHLLILKEEKYLTDIHGTTYMDYQNKTGRYL